MDDPLDEEVEVVDALLHVVGDDCHVVQRRPRREERQPGRVDVLVQPPRHGDELLLDARQVLLLRQAARLQHQDVLVPDGAPLRAEVRHPVRRVHLVDGDQDVRLLARLELENNAVVPRGLRVHRLGARRVHQVAPERVVDAHLE